MPLDSPNEGLAGQRYTTSMRSSALRAISTSPGARVLIAWWWQLFTLSFVFFSREAKGVSGRMSGMAPASSTPSRDPGSIQ